MSAIMTCCLCDPPVEITLDADGGVAAVREYDDKHYNRTHGHLVDAPDVIGGPGQMWRAAALEAITTLAAGDGQFTFGDVAGVVGQPVNPRGDWRDLADDITHRGIAHAITYDNDPHRVWRGGPAPERNPE